MQRIQHHLCQDIQQHPPDKHKLALQNKDDRLQTVHCGDHDNRNERQWCFTGRDDDDKVEDVAECSGEDLLVSILPGVLSVTPLPVPLTSIFSPLQAYRTDLSRIALTIVPNKSINTTNRILKQQNPHSSGNVINSTKLCTVELIHRLR